MEGDFQSRTRQQLVAVVKWTLRLEWEGGVLGFRLQEWWDESPGEVDGGRRVVLSVWGGLVLRAIKTKVRKVWEGSVWVDCRGTNIQSRTSPEQIEHGRVQWTRVRAFTPEDVLVPWIEMFFWAEMQQEVRICSNWLSIVRLSQGGHWGTRAPSYGDQRGQRRVRPPSAHGIPARPPQTAQQTPPQRRLQWNDVHGSVERGSDSSVNVHTPVIHSKQQ